MWDDIKHVETDKKKQERVDQAIKKKKVSEFQPTLDQVFYGYDKPKADGTFTRKKGIFEMSLTDKDRERVEETYAYLKQGKVHVDVPMSKVSKTYVLTDLYPIVHSSLREERLKEMVENMPDNYYCITTVEQFEWFISLLSEETEMALDVETTGLDTYGDVTVGFSATLPKADVHVYAPYGHVTGESQLPKDYVLSHLAKTIRQDQVVFLHNAKFDLHMFIFEKYSLKAIFKCTQLRQQILNENEMSKQLKVLLTKYKDHLGFVEDSYTYEQLFGKDFPFAECPLDVATAYACKDTHGTYLLGKFQEKYLVDGLKKLHDEIEQPLLEYVVKMEREGLFIDLDFAHKYERELAEQLETLEREIEIETKGINLNSPKQVAEWLYDDLKLDPPGGNRKTDKETLKMFSDDVPIIKKILQYRDLGKLHGTYISKIPNMIKSDGRVHGQFKQDHTDTGRFSSESPNLQNFPARARNMVIPEEGSLLMSIDYSQIEPRYLSHISNSVDLISTYTQGIDLYAKLASDVFNLPIEQCGDGSIYRKMMKTGLLAVMYGTSMWTLSKQLKISTDEAEKFIADFFKAYPEVRTFIDKTYYFAMEHEYVQDAFGRKRRFPGHRQYALAYEKMASEICQYTGTETLPHDYWDWKKYTTIPRELKQRFKPVRKKVERERRQMVNFLIQGASASIMKKAIIECGKMLRPEERLIATIHDENLFEVPIDISKERITSIAETMENAVSISVPLKCDIEISTRWGSGFKFNTTTQRFFLKNEDTGEMIFEVDELDEALLKFKELG